LAESGCTERVAYFEWSAPQDADPADRRVWRMCMPALECNGGIISEDAIAADYLTMGINEFRRAYLNHWVAKDAPPDPVISGAQWDGLTDPDFGRLSPVAFGVTVAPDRSYSTVAVAGWRLDGLAQIEIMAEQAGVDWAAEWVADRVDRWNPLAVVLDGTAKGLALPLAKQRIETEHTTSTDRAQATVDFYDAVTHGRLRHTGDPLLALEVAGAGKRSLGERWLWEGSPVGRLQAATLAHHGLLTHSKPPTPATPLRASQDTTAAIGETADLASLGF
jgi:hypothetical protein